MKGFFRWCYVHRKALFRCFKVIVNMATAAVTAVATTSCMGLLK